jgi:hypothetical protein
MSLAIIVIALCLLEQTHPRLIGHGKALLNGLIRTLLWCVLGFGMLMAFQIPAVWGSCLVLFLAILTCRLWYWFRLPQPLAPRPQVTLYTACGWWVDTVSLSGTSQTCPTCGEKTMTYVMVASPTPPLCANVSSPSPHTHGHGCRHAADGFKTVGFLSHG